jgi:leucyl/phenylalanyl-tRNA--protein transferase
MAFRIRTLSPEDPPDHFPDPATADVALGYPDGLIAIGGDLSSERLLAAYSRGIFPWYNDDQPVLWWSPDPRAVIAPTNFHMSRSLQRELRRHHWEYSLNQHFSTVIDACATGRGEHGTWITADMQNAFIKLHQLGYAHSVESWRDGELAGGIYGVRLGKIFFAESMYTRRTAGSKVALSGLVYLALRNGIDLIDCQLESPHLASLGMQSVPRSEFLAALPALIDAAIALPNWHFERQPAAVLAELRNTAGPDKAPASETGSLGATR